MYLLWFCFALNSCINLEFICFVIWCQLIKSFKESHINVLTSLPAPKIWNRPDSPLWSCQSVWMLIPFHPYCILRNPLKVGLTHVSLPSWSSWLICLLILGCQSLKSLIWLNREDFSRAQATVTRTHGVILIWRWFLDKERATSWLYLVMNPQWGDCAPANFVCSSPGNILQAMTMPPPTTLVSAFRGFLLTLHFSCSWPLTNLCLCASQNLIAGFITYMKVTLHLGQILLLNGI